MLIKSVEHLFGEPESQIKGLESRIHSLSYRLQRLEVEHDLAQECLKKLKAQVSRKRKSERN